MNYSADIKKLPRHFLPEDYKVTTWESLEPYFKDLLDRPVESKTDLEKLWIEIPKLKKMFEQKERRSSFANLHRLQEVKSLSAEERYLDLIQKHPQIFQRIPLQYIAMYLDIEPPSLSRLRKRLSGK